MENKIQFVFRFSFLMKELKNKLLKVAATDMRYFAMCKFFRSLVHKKSSSLI